MANPMFLSGQVVSVYAAAQGIRSNQSSWDYAFEDPLRDARGWQLDRQTADPSQLTDIEDPTLANVVLTNGARYYVDHAHPEYSSPEVTLPRDAVTWDRAGDADRARVGPPDRRAPRAAAGEPLQEQRRRQGPVLRHARELPHAPAHALPRHRPRPHPVLRDAPGRLRRRPGRAGGRQPGAGYQISQRADFFETEVGLETTLKRPIINTRDEPHAVADRYRRLHVIIGDANHLDVASLLKTGTTSLVLGMIEDGHLTEDWSVRRPVAALQTISHDPSLRPRSSSSTGAR